MIIDQDALRAFFITFVLVASLSLLFVLILNFCTQWFENPGVIVQDTEMDIEMRIRAPPPTTTIHRVITSGVRQQAAVAADESHDHLPAMEEQEYKSSSRRDDKCVICLEEFKEMESIQNVD
ncbi:hypothetical protein Ccrd_011083 [Cynara cardunculus var. scolymus]|uniref:Uncharacterized protein n=1 Tax=Cynara cardunculus var. scolymus TaxID=59895 RepID=A0A103YK22_CYNCS|nr:hypothetical protein Ccrd_011083 [Cynara cardunculus var. scolymus]